MKHLKVFNENVKPYSKTFDCRNVINATNFVKRIMFLAEQRDHHPAIIVNRFSVTVELMTHSTNSVTDADIDMMSDIEKLYAKLD